MNKNRLAELDLTTDEIKRFGDAFHDETFKQLLSQYLLEINDPDNRALFEREIIQLEKERGNDIEFVSPQPSYALKTSIDGKDKAYVNICGNDRIDRVDYVLASRDNVRGVEVLIPHAVAPVQKYRRKNGHLASVFTVIYHCATLKFAASNVHFKRAVEETAFSAVEKSYDVKLDLINSVVSKRPFKGYALSTTLNKKTTNVGTIINDASKNKTACVEPTYRIKYRNEIDLQNSTTDRYCKMDVLIPTFVIVEVDLPLLNSIEMAELNVRPTSITFANEQPAYKLHINLPYAVNEKGGSAKFDSVAKILTLELAVIKKPTQLARNDVVAEIENSSDSLASETPKVSSSEFPHVNAGDQFLNANLKYNLPSYSCNYLNGKLAFVFHVRNINTTSFDYRLLEKKNGFWVKFWNIGAGQYTMHYSAAVLFSQNNFNVVRSLNYLIEDENVFLYAHLQSDVVPLEYFIGIDPDHTKKEYLNEPDAVLAEIENNKSENLGVDFSVSKFTSEEVIIDIVAKKNSNINVPKFSENVDEKPQTFARPIDFNTFCDQFKMKFSLDEELQCVSEPEMSRRNEKTKNCDKVTGLDAKNRSWIVQANKTKKSKRRRKGVAIQIKPTSEQEIENQPSPTEVTTNDNNTTIEQHTEITDMRSAYKYADLVGYIENQPHDVRETNRSILKKNRSFSESSGDEMYHVNCFRSFSVDEINYSSDSYSQSLPKKTVTFNDTICKKWYSSEISILEQRKRAKRRNQRKERKASDSDNSETETTLSAAVKCENIRLYNESLASENSELESTSLSESGGETSDGDQSDNPDCIAPKPSHVPCSKKSHKRRGKKSARKNASTAKHNFHVSE